MANKKNKLVKSSPPPVIQVGGEDYANKYNKAVDTAELSTMFLISSNFDMSSTAMKYSQSKFSDESCDKRFNGSVEVFSADLDNGEAFGKFRWTLDIIEKEEENDKNNKLVSIKADYFIILKNIECDDESIVKDFFRSFSRTLSYPYFRSLVSTHSGWSNIDIPTLPIVKYSKLARQ